MHQTAYKGLKTVSTPMCSSRQILPSVERVLAIYSCRFESLVHAGWFGICFLPLQSRTAGLKALFMLVGLVFVSCPLSLLHLA